MDWAQRYVFPGDVVWDIGANVGLFSFCAAQTAGPSGQVVAVEPDTFLTDLLRRTARRNRRRIADTIVLPVAVSDGVSIQPFTIAERGRSANYLSKWNGSTMAGGSRETQHVISVTLDWMAERLPAPDVIKIDVERAELAVLQGAQQLLRDVKPRIICEVGSEQSEQVTALFRSFGYQLHDPDKPESDQLESAAFNTLAVAA